MHDLCLFKEFYKEHSDIWFTVGVGGILVAFYRHLTYIYIHLATGVPCIYE